MLANDMASPAPRTDTTTPRRSNRPLDDLQLLCRLTPGSSSSSRGAGGGGGGGGGSGSFYRNSLGTLSERGEGRDAASNGEEEEGDEGQSGKEGGGCDKERLGGEALKEPEEGGTGGQDAGALWEAAAAAAGEG